jgi:hypothetical protein
MERTHDLTQGRSFDLRVRAFDVVFLPFPTDKRRLLHAALNSGAPATV